MHHTTGPLPIIPICAVPSNKLMDQPNYPVQHLQVLQAIGAACVDLCRLLLSYVLYRLLGSQVGV